MHEISLVQNLFQQLKDLARENNASKIHTVTVEIGPLSGVVVDSFQFGFDTLAAGEEILKEAKLVVQVPEVDYQCSDCGKISSSSGARPERCPQCGDSLLIPRGGEDLLLLQVEMQ
ncbi:MAG: hydrogenase accessory protein HypA [Desulfobacterales bacterium]|nr:MAG: hydrogenase accessory protein HypA [Desulfobacterales bacterium]